MTRQFAVSIKGGPVVQVSLETLPIWMDMILEKGNVPIVREINNEK